MENNSLTHHGIKGQKWGIRRYKNKIDKKKKKNKKIYSEDRNEYDVLRKKDYRELSNSEIQKLLNRQRLEIQYRQLNPSKLTKIKNFVKGAYKAISIPLNLLNTYTNTMNSISNLSTTNKITMDYINKGKNFIDKIIPSTNIPFN